MADDTKDINYRVKVSDETASGIKSAEKNVEGMIHRLKEGLGKESTLGNIGELLHGAGAVAGLSIAGRGLSELSAKAVELREAVQGMQGDWASNTVEIGKAIPVLGHWVEAGQNIRELITHEGDDLKRITSESDNITLSVDLQRKSIIANTKAHEDQLEVIKRIKQETSLIGVEGVARAKMQAGFESENIAADQAKAIKEREDQIRVAAGEQLKPVRAAQFSAQRRLDEVREEAEGAERRLQEARQKLAAGPGGNIGDRSRSQLEGDVSSAESAAATKKKIAGDIEASLNQLRSREGSIAKDREAALLKAQQDSADIVKATQERAAKELAEAERQHDVDRLQAQQKYQKESEASALEHVSRLIQISGGIRESQMRAKGPAWAVAADFDRLATDRQASLADISSREAAKSGTYGLFHLGALVKDSLFNGLERYGIGRREQAGEAQRLREEQDRNGKIIGEKIQNALGRTGDYLHRAFVGPIDPYSLDTGPAKFRLGGGGDDSTSGRGAAIAEELMSRFVGKRPEDAQRQQLDIAKEIVNWTKAGAEGIKKLVELIPAVPRVYNGS